MPEMINQTELERVIKRVLEQHLADVAFRGEASPLRALVRQEVSSAVDTIHRTKMAMMANNAVRRHLNLEIQSRIAEQELIQRMAETEADLSGCIPEPGDRHGDLWTNDDYRRLKEGFKHFYHLMAARLGRSPYAVYCQYRRFRRNEGWEPWKV